MKRIKILLVSLLFVPLISAAAAALDYKDEATQHYKRGKLLYDQGMFKDAEEEFRKAKQLIEEGKAKEAAQQKEKEDTERILEEQKKQFAEKSESPVREAKPVKSGTYTISEGDVLQVKVWQNEDLNDELIVRPDGMISFPLIGDIAAADLTIKEFQNNLTTALKEYIRNPQLSVSIKKIAGKRIIVLGEVKSPGVYAVTGKKTILEAVGLAGGFTEHAVLKSVILVRGGLENPKPQRFNLSRAIRNGDLKENIVLESEDIIYVPKKYLADLNYYLRLILDPVSRGVFTVKEYNDL